MADADDIVYAERNVRLVEQTVRHIIHSFLTAVACQYRIARVAQEPFSEYRWY